MLIFKGKLDKNGVGRVKPRFPIESWNLYNRVLNNLPRINNSVESWHSQIQATVRKHLKVKDLVELLLDEQSKVETDLIKIRKGVVNSRKKSSIEKDKCIYNKVINYDSDNIKNYLTDISLNFV